MHVGMNRQKLSSGWTVSGVPHARGDEPITHLAFGNGGQSSPCTWG